MKLFQKIAEAFRGASAEASANRTKALSRLGPPKIRFEGGLAA
jgi:hypothetical protein